MSLCLVGKRRGKSHSGMVLLENAPGTCRFCNAKQYAANMHLDKTSPCFYSFYVESTSDVVALSNHTEDDLLTT